MVISGNGTKCFEMACLQNVIERALWTQVTKYMRKCTLKKCDIFESNRNHFKLILQFDNMNINKKIVVLIRLLRICECVIFDLDSLAWNCYAQILDC